MREDGREGDVFSLIGPKKYDVPWKVLEKQGWIADRGVHGESAIAMPQESALEYALAERCARAVPTSPPRTRPSSTSCGALVDRHRREHDDNVLVIGQYLDQLDVIAAMLDAPLITGKTPHREREQLYDDVPQPARSSCSSSRRWPTSPSTCPTRTWRSRCRAPSARRQEEAQRLGRILRPKADGALAHFYTVVTRDTLDQDSRPERQLFLTEQGYRYTILDATDLLSRVPGS